MAVIEELIRLEDDGSISFGNYLMDENGNEYLDYYVEYIWNEDGTYGGFNLYQVAERND